MIIWYPLRSGLLVCFRLHKSLQLSVRIASHRTRTHLLFFSNINFLCASTGLRREPHRTRPPSGLGGWITLSETAGKGSNSNYCMSGYRRVARARASPGLPVRAMAASLLEVGDGWRKYLWTATMLVTTFTPFHSVPSRRHLRSA